MLRNSIVAWTVWCCRPPNCSWAYVVDCVEVSNGLFECSRDVQKREELRSKDCFEAWTTRTMSGKGNYYVDKFSHQESLGSMMVGSIPQKTFRMQFVSQHETQLNIRYRTSYNVQQHSKADDSTKPAKAISVHLGDHLSRVRRARAVHRGMRSTLGNLIKFMFFNASGDL